MEKQITWQLRDGRKITATISHEFKKVEKIGYADGWNVPLGHDYIDDLKTVCAINGKWVESGTKFEKRDNLPIVGAVARMGKIMIMEDTFRKLQQAYVKIEASMMENPEYVAYKAAKEEELKKREERFKAEIEQTKKYDPLKDPCPKCGSYCLGDCQG